MFPTEIILGTKFAEAVVPKIAAAKTSICIMIFDWRWYSDKRSAGLFAFNEALREAAQRGVQVLAVVRNASLRDQLVRAGIKTELYEDDRLLHLKMILIDNSILITGSHNYTQSGFDGNLELSVCVDVSHEPQLLRSYFDTIFSIKKHRVKVNGRLS